MDNQTDNIKSLGGNLWKTAEADERAAELIVQKYNLPYIVARILTLRGVSVDEVAGFIDPKIQNLMPNPFVLKDMEKAASIEAVFGIGRLYAGNSYSRTG